MAYDWQNRATARPGAWADVDTGLRQYMLRVYNYMGAGLALTGLVAYAAAASGIYASIAHTWLIYVVMFAPVAAVLLLVARIQTMSLGAAQASFWGFAGLMGLSLAYVFLLFTGVSIASTFLITATMFLGTSLYGYTTGRDLSGVGSFMVMGVIGLLVAMVVNMFLASPALQFAISVIGVIVFTGLTAWDTQRIKESYVVGDDGTLAGKKAIYGALTLYLDFLNLFLFMLQFMGQRRD
jgi:FtsH-binding integral membrane protein